MTRVNVSRWDELPLEKITEMVARKVVARGPVMLTQAYFKKGAVVPLHAHAADVVVYVLQGALRAQVAGDDVTVREGEVVIIPAHAPHQTETLDDTFLMTFTAGASG
jgi:quercetin dioxygenase-like cupin family protein